MTKDDWTDWFASLLVTAGMVLLLNLLDAPPWAMLLGGSLTFWLMRLGDKLGRQ